MRNKSVLVAAIIFIIGIAILTVVTMVARPPTNDADRIRLAKNELAQGNWTTAAKLASSVTQPDKREESLLIQAEAVERQSGATEALKFLLAETLQHPRSTTINRSIAKLAITSGALTEALRATDSILAAEPCDTDALRHSALLNGIVGRRWKSLNAYWSLLKLGTISVNELAIFADIERPIDAGEILKDAVSNHPSDQLALLGLNTWSRNFADGNDSSPGALVSESPDELAAQVLWGTYVLDRQTDEFTRWNAQLPENAESHAPIWVLRGDWFRRQSKMRLAAKCYWKALCCAPVYRTATYELGKTLQFLNHPEAESVIEKAELMFKMAEHLDVIIDTGGLNELAMQGVTQTTLMLGRVWEAAAWAVLSQRLFPNRSWPNNLRLRAVERLMADSPRVLPEENPALKIDLSDWGDVHSALSQPATRSNTPDTHHHNIHFVETDVVQFEYNNGANPSTPGARMFEITGGGIAIIDYDLDGWPDMFFSQGGDWPEGRRQPPATFGLNDEIHRNQRGLHFANASEAAGMQPGGFGQGVTVTDFNADGFPDLIIANVGRNQILENTGVGTFIDVTNESGIQAEDWTTSVAAGDINNDGLPDLYFVNYLNGDDVFTKICQQRACSPLVFDGTPDQVYLNNGDGRFSEGSIETPQNQSKGLGIVMCSIGDHSGVDVFVANDQVPNFHLSAAAADPDTTSQSMKLMNQGLVSGLAYSEDGLAMACMGIAATDLNHDGRLDFHVTNFRDEPNTLYYQQAAELFVDVTRASGLRAPSLPYVGWGTQFLDADNDGDADLVVANGHTDEFPAEEGGYAMPTLFFANKGGADFELLPSDRCGVFFADKIVGRGLVKLDWNWDGRPEFAVSTLLSGVRLTTNQSIGGAWIDIELVSFNGVRDHVGASVRIGSADLNQTQQVTSGDGYMVSNQRSLHFGLGEATQLAELCIGWQGNDAVVHSRVQTNQRYRAVDDRLYEIPR